MIEEGALDIFTEVLKHGSPADELQCVLNCIWSMSFEEKVKKHGQISIRHEE
jgi:hypothetical protein